MESATIRSFNPSGKTQVDEIKRLTDELIDYVRANTPDGPVAGRRSSLAVTNYEQAAMWAVKAMFP